MTSAEAEPGPAARVSAPAAGLEALGERRRRGRPTLPRSALIYVVLAVGAVLTLAPFLLSTMTAFKSPADFAQNPALALPTHWSLHNFLTVLFGPAQLGRAVVVTVLVAAFIVFFQVVFSILAAYAFARVDFPGRAGLFWVYLSTLMVPPVVIVIPLYLMMSELGLRNTFWGLVLPFAFASPYAVFLLREYFRGIPRDLIDAARLDGASTLDILVEVVVPLSKPIIVTLVLITAVSQWNNFMWPLIITTGPDWRVLTVATSSLQTQHDANWTLVMAATTIAVVPLIALFLVFQKHIVRSISITGIR